MCIGKSKKSVWAEKTVYFIILYFLLSHPGLCNETLSLNKQPPPDKITTLFINISSEKDTVIKCKLGTETRTYKTKAPPIEQLRSFLDLGSHTPNHRYSEVEPILLEYSKAFIEPIQDLLEKAHEVEFVLRSPSLIQMPFDLLFFKDKPLFLQKPTVYSFTEVGPIKLDLMSMDNVLLISDITADPDRGVEIIQAQISAETFKDISDVTLETFRSLKNLDMLLLSAHGKVFDDKPDYIEIGESQLRPEDLRKLKAKLVYFDSCSLGGSMEFIRQLRSNPVSVYVAPWVPNEAGDSSTNTMKLFFKALELYSYPSYALFLTRKQLYNHYSNLPQISFLALFRSFPFRIYRFTAEQSNLKHGIRREK